MANNLVINTMAPDSESQGRIARKRMWPSFETATRLYDIANFFLIGTLVVGVVATALVVWMGNVKEEYLRRDLAETNARAEEAIATAKQAESNLAGANSRAEEAKAAAAVANARAAEANQKAEEERLARVQIEERLADRRLTDEQAENISNKVKSFTGQEYEVTTYWDMREPLSLANRIHQLLTKASWKYVKPEGGSMLFPGVAGIQVYVHPEAEERTKDAATSLVSALTDENIIVELRQQNAPNNPNNKLYVNIGTKPQ